MITVSNKVSKRYQLTRGIVCPYSVGTGTLHALTDPQVKSHVRDDGNRVFTLNGYGMPLGYFMYDTETQQNLTLVNVFIHPPESRFKTGDIVTYAIIPMDVVVTKVIRVHSIVSHSKVIPLKEFEHPSYRQVYNNSNKQHQFYRLIFHKWEYQLEGLDEFVEDTFMNRPERLRIFTEMDMTLEYNQ